MEPENPGSEELALLFQRRKDFQKERRSFISKKSIELVSRVSRLGGLPARETVPNLIPTRLNRQGGLRLTVLVFGS